MVGATAIEHESDYRSRRCLDREFLSAVARHSADHAQDRFGYELKIQITA
jgi:hypothetical protein